MASGMKHMKEQISLVQKSKSKCVEKITQGSLSRYTYKKQGSGVRNINVGSRSA